jgi:hypothetical protein
MITQEELKELFEYKDGQLLAKVKYYPNTRIGVPIGGVNSLGYMQTSIHNKKYYLHRLIFLYHYGYFPESVDHIDHDRTNNRIENLRAATLQENNCNLGMRATNKSGVKNVHWNKTNKNWNVTLRHKNKSMYFGSFDDLELAELVACEARAKYHGRFACDA